MNTVSFNKLREGDVGYIMTDKKEYFSACYSYVVNDKTVTSAELMTWFNYGENTRPVQVLTVGRRYITFLGAVTDMKGKYIPIIFCMPAESYLMSCILDELGESVGDEEKSWRPQLYFYRCDNVAVNERNQKQNYVFLNKGIPTVCGYLFEDSQYVYATEKRISAAVRLSDVSVLSDFPYLKIPKDVYYACAVPISTGDTRQEGYIFDALTIDTTEITLVSLCKKVGLFAGFTDSPLLLRGEASKRFKADLLKMLEMKVRGIQKKAGVLQCRPMLKTMSDKTLSEFTIEEIKYLKEVLNSADLSQDKGSNDKRDFLLD